MDYKRIYITMAVDYDEAEKLLQLGMIDDNTSEQQIITAIHDLIYDRYELETR